MAIALGGRPDDSAKMVCSRGCIAYLSPSPLKRQRNFDFATDLVGGRGKAARVQKCCSISRSNSLDLCCGNQPISRAAPELSINHKLFQILMGQTRPRSAESAD